MSQQPRPTRISTLVRYTHLMTGSSTVRCGRHMRDGQHPEGWDLGTVRVDYLGVTCPACYPRRDR